MTDKQKVILSCRVLFRFGLVAEARALWREWKRSTEFADPEVEAAAAQADAERRHLEEIAL